MTPTPVPDEEMWEGTVRTVIGPPGNDLDSGIAPVEVLVDTVDGTPVIRIRCVIEEHDVRRIAEGERVFWLSMYGDHLHPFSVDMPELPEGYATCANCPGVVGREEARGLWRHLTPRWVDGAWECVKPEPRP